MRLNSPVAMIVRRAIEDIEHDGLFIPRGTDFIMLWAVSCRDPRAFSDPNQFVLDRGTRTSQFTFGGGPYICGGRNVARIVGETLAAEMANGGFALEFAGEPTLIHDRTGRDVIHSCRSGSRRSEPPSVYLRQEREPMSNVTYIQPDGAASPSTSPSASAS